jgi:hypothetical protein
LHLLYCDETNLEERQGDFLIYGGLMIDADRVLDLSSAIDDLRGRYGINRDYRLKFNPGPEGLSHAKFVALKQEALEIIAGHGARLVVYVILHDIAVDPDTARRNGINTVCYHFHCLLNRFGGPGLVLIDRFNDAGNAIEAHLRDKFSIGLTDMPYRDEMRLANIIGFHYSAIGQSHLPSLIDIVLGSLRFAINAHTRRQNQHLQTSKALLELLSPLFWRQRDGEPVPELSFLFSPKIVRSDRFRGQYEALKQFLAEGGIPTAQQITDQRMY